MNNIMTSFSGTGVPIYGNDIDTDRIIPARFLKELTFDHMGDYLFYDVRFDASGKKLDHPTNDPRFANASIMIVQNNFGCGSSREHAAQAVKRYGIKAIIGESFSEIFSGNCNAIGVPLVTADAETISKLQAYIEENPSAQLTLNLEAKTISADGFSIDVDLPESRRASFLKGTWDVATLLSSQKDAIRNVYDSLPYTSNFK